MTRDRINFSHWSDNAVCLVQAEELNAGNTYYVEMDDLRVQRDEVMSDSIFTEDFSTYPDGIELGGVPDAASYPPDKWSTNLNAHSYVEGSGLVWVPDSYPGGWTWYNPRRTYQQDPRFVLTGTNVLEMQMSCSAFSNGIMKMALMPEYVPTELYGGYNGPVIYTEIKFENSSQLVFDLVRQWGVRTNRQWVAASHNNNYDPDKKITFQVGQYSARVYYGTNCIINSTHHTNALAVYSNGAYPHFEYQNEDDTRNAVSVVDDVRVQHLSGFTNP